MGSPQAEHLGANLLQTQKTAIHLQPPAVRLPFWELTCGSLWGNRLDCLCQQWRERHPDTHCTQCRWNTWDGTLYWELSKSSMNIPNMQEVQKRWWVFEPSLWLALHMWHISLVSWCNLSHTEGCHPHCRRVDWPTQVLKSLKIHFSGTVVG